MYNSILQFIEKDIKEIEKMMWKILEGEADTDDLSATIHGLVLGLGKNLQAEIYERVDQEIRDSLVRKKKWNIEQRNEPKKLLDIMGTISFQRTGYKDKQTEEYIYLLDRVLGLGGHQKITLGAAAQILEETVMSSYARGGKRASVTDFVSKQTVMNLVHDTEIEMPLTVPKEKKKMKYLHIVADEDHVAAQFNEVKGDLKKGENGQKSNTLQPKLICLYEDIRNESGENSKSPRYALTGKHYFCGIYKGAGGNEKLWGEVADYINTNYDTEVLERVYIAGDGAAWIKTGSEVLEKSRFVLDKFHMMKYVNTSVTHMLDSIDDVKSEIWEALNGGNKKELKDVYQRILNVTESESKKEEVESALKYFLNNWSGIVIRTEEAGGCWKCCAEGQVSHVLSERMSSRPMGWSSRGCDQMAKLRVYKWNGENIIDLLKFQKKQQEKEERRTQQEELIKELRKRQSGWDYGERLRASVPGIERREMGWLRDMIGRALA